MSTRLFLLALPGALALGLLAHAQEVGGSTPAGKKTSVFDPVRIYYQAKKHQGPAGPYYENKTPVPSAVNYCQSTANSTNLPAWMDCAGDLSVCHNNTCLRTEYVPADVMGMYIYGTKPAELPFGNGYLCISPVTPGLFRLPPVITNLDQTAQLKVDLKSLPAGGEILPGSTWYFQFWFRDPLGGGEGFNLSDGLKVKFCP